MAPARPKLPRPHVLLLRRWPVDAEGGRRLLHRGQYYADGYHGGVAWRHSTPTAPTFGRRRKVGVRRLSCSVHACIVSFFHLCLWVLFFSFCFIFTLAGWSYCHGEIFLFGIVVCRGLTLTLTIYDYISRCRAEQGFFSISKKKSGYKFVLLTIKTPQ
jgi:hypothetical protein